MSERYNGGPAFPVDTRGSGESEDGGSFGHQTSPSTWQFSGMTLRDYFAAKAMQGLIATQNYGSAESVCAKDAYDFADAMLEERSAT